MKNQLLIRKRLSQLLYCFSFMLLFANTAMSQDTFTWSGPANGDWATAANWTKTGTVHTDTYPGETNGRKLDIVVIDNGGTPIVAANANPYGMSTLTISNATGGDAGSKLTINNGATITVENSTILVVILKGGSIENNGILNVKSTSALATNGITMQVPSPLPAAPTEYVYSGNGTINIDISSAAVGNGACFFSSSNNANSTYKMLFNGTTNFTMPTGFQAFAVRAGNSSPLIIGGTGFTIGGANGGLISLNSATKVTVEAGTLLTMNCAATNLSRGILMFNGSTNATTFINKGTIDILGSTTVPGISFSTGATAVIPFTFNNEGTININVNATGPTAAPLAMVAATAYSAGTLVSFSNTGTLTLKNTSTVNGYGFPIFVANGSQTPPMTLTNDGTMNLEGSTYSYGTSKITLANNGTINSNNAFLGFVSITNSATGIINFVKTAATATTRQVTFSGVSSGASGAFGNIYKDASNNEYAAVQQKFITATTYVANVLSSVTVPTGSGTLTFVSGTGTTTASFTYTSVSVPAGVNNALPFAVTNDGTINTGTASDLNIISGVALTATSVIAPGGASGKGIAIFTGAPKALVGTLKLQVSGNATAGVDYDQITNSTTDGGFSIDAVNSTLDVTGISGVASPVDIIVANGSGTITGTFVNVTGLTAGWSVNYGVVGKVQLVYLPTTTTWIGVTSTGWITPTNWLDGIVPNNNSDVIIGNGDFQPKPFVNVTIKSLTIDAGSTLTINTTFNFTVKEAITNNGSITIQNNANLIQVDNVANGGSGSTIIKRNSNPLYRLDYTMWSSPVSGAQTLAQFSPLTTQSPNNRFFTYDPSSDLYVNVSPSSPFATGTGYLIRMPNTDPTTDYDAGTATLTYNGEFTGTPNNGTVPLNTLTSGKYYSVGNPYPSTISADAFINGNSTDGTLYFWRKKNAAAGSAYATYNLVGETVTAAGSGVAGEGSAAPNGTIQVGQGFIVKTASTSLAFTNLMRLGNTSTQFFKTKQVQKDRVWLNLSRPASKMGTIDIPEVFSQALIGYMDGATLGVDNGIDGKYINDSKTALTSNINDEEYTIQGRPAFDATDVVALNFKNDADVTYTIALDHFDGVFATGQDIYLLDSKTGIETDLKAGSYTFAATAGTDNARFSLKYQKTLRVDAPAFNENSVSVYKNNGTLYVNAGSVTINTIEVYDVQGRLLASQRNVKATTASINNLRASNQVLIVKIAGEDNSVVTKKVVN